jgi:hypothetical protein
MDISKVNPMSVRIKDIIITNSKDNSNVSLFVNTVFTDMMSRASGFDLPTLPNHQELHCSHKRRERQHLGRQLFESQELLQRNFVHRSGGRLHRHIPARGAHERLADHTRAGPF